jgi:hypothetical protein
VIREEPVKGRDHRLDRELLQAMERARSQLAVAIAAENKTTPRERWRYYLETEDRMRRCVREIRRYAGLNIGKPFGWLQALDLLNQPLPVPDQKSQGEAQRLCRRLRDILKIVENPRPVTSDEEQMRSGIRKTRSEEQMTSGIRKARSGELTASGIRKARSEEQTASGIRKARSGESSSK